MKYTQRMMGAALTVVAATAVVLVAMLWLSGAFRSGAVKPGKVPAATERTVSAAGPVVVKRVARERYAEVVGSIQAETRTTVSARLVANIVEMKVNAGDFVVKGQVLALLDDAAPKARVEQARQSLRSAQASMELAQIQMDRLAKLVEVNAAARYDVDEWRTKLSVAKADMGRYQQAIAEAESGLQDAVIRAPFDGVVIDRQAEPGEQAAPGRPLATVYDPSKLRLEASVREAYAGRLRVGQEMSIYIDALGRERPGAVTQIVPAADPGSRSFLVKVSLRDVAGVFPGMYGRMRLPLGEDPVLEIPKSAVREIGQVTLVDVVGDDGVVSRRAVRVGRADAQRVEVLAGLQEGDRVVP